MTAVDKKTDSYNRRHATLRLPVGHMLAMYGVRITHTPTKTLRDQRTKLSDCEAIANYTPTEFY